MATERGRGAGTGDWDDYEAFLEKLFEEARVPGMAIAVARDGRRVHFHAYGQRDTEEHLPATPDTVYGIGSITKSFTAVAIMQLQERGKLSVEDPVRRWLPEYRTSNEAYAARTTIHHFLTHTAGLPPLPTLRAALVRSILKDPEVADDPDARRQLEAVEPIDTTEQLLEALGKSLAEKPFEVFGEPGRYFSYSNDAYALLGVIIERASGEPYEDYVRKHILEPAGMRRSAFQPSEVEKWPNVAMLYAETKEKGRTVIRRSPGFWECLPMASAGFLKSSPDDMLRYAEIYRTGGVVHGTRILSEESVAAMTQPYIRAAGAMHYGYGLMITEDYHGRKLVEHGGNVKGCSAWMMVVPQEGISCVELCNLVSAPGDRVALAAVNHELGLPVDTPREDLPDHPCPADRMLEYTGRYVSGEGADETVYADSRGLAIVAQGETIRGRYVGDDRFLFSFKGHEMVGEFLRDSENRVWAFQFGFRIVRRAPDDADTSGAAAEAAAGAR